MSGSGPKTAPGTRQTGSADSPLHQGRVPAWLALRMSRLGAVMGEAIIHHYGRDELLRRLANPFWFQAFGAVMGMDWHSSGITTSVLAALKSGLAPLERELGVHVCGGRGKHGHNTPAELIDIGERVGLDGAALAGTSRLIAQGDSAAVQDGYNLYLHRCIGGDGGKWGVGGRGMSAGVGGARRYHWLSEGLESFVEAPHTAIAGPSQGHIINLTDRRAAPSRQAQLDLLDRLGPDGIAHKFSALRMVQGTANSPPGQLTLHLVMPAHHAIRPGDVI